MQLVADLHVHSKYSRAVSPDMVLPIMAKWAVKKGIDILATADWTHPLWFREIKANLEESSIGLFKLKSSSYSKASEDKQNKTHFILSTEISSIYSQGGQVRRVHNLILSPGFETCEKINQELVKRGCNLSSDGRPIVGISSKNLLEMVLSIDKNALFIPCHVWTPWFSLYGSKSGFDSIEECFGEYVNKIYAVETGLSSDPQMNWRIKELENRSIVSSSDSHSPAKMGREATIFTVQNSKFKNQNDSSKFKITYDDLVAAIKRDPEGNLKIGYTIEFYPEEGKYHYTGHRNCKVVQSPEETNKNGEICPVCKKPLTVGVMHRVEQLAQQQSINNYRQSTDKFGVTWVEDSRGIHPPFVKLVPLNEIIAESLASTVSSVKVKSVFDQMCGEFGSEIKILLTTPIQDLEKAQGPKIAEGVAKVRKSDIVIEPGFDGEYGKVKIWGEKKSAENRNGEKEEAQLGLF
ncbi:MAG: endonuclease Q family protein [Candidatus Levyibacteriota bacterium]